MNKNLIIIVLILIILLLGYFASNKKDPTVKTIVTHDTIPGDSIPKYITVEVKKPYKIYLPQDTIIMPSDSSCMTEWKRLYTLYWSKKIYIDTLLNDTSAFVSIEDTVYNNSLHTRKLGFQNKRPTVINTTINTTILNNKEWYISGCIGSSFIMFGLTYHYNNYLFTGGFEITNKTPVIGISYKIK